jgi:hypothetical protein
MGFVLWKYKSSVKKYSVPPAEEVERLSTLGLNRAEVAKQLSLPSHVFYRYLDNSAKLTEAFEKGKRIYEKKLG